MDSKEVVVVETNEGNDTRFYKLKKIGQFVKNVLKKIDYKKLIFIMLFFLECYFISEFLNGNEVYFNKMLGFKSSWKERSTAFGAAFMDFFKFPKFFANYFLLIFIYWIIYGLTNRSKLTCTVIMCVTFLFGVINYVVTDLRGMSITISDIYSIRTAANVAKGIKLGINQNFVIATIIFIGCLFITFKFVKIEDKREGRGTKAKAITVLIGFVGIIALVGPNYFTDDVELWNINRAYANSGAGLTIARMAKDISVKKPANYSVKEVQNVLAKYEDDTNKIIENTEFWNYENDYPNVVVIMNESFADLNMVYDVEGLNEDPIPYFHELIKQENVVSGVMHSSQFGGGTANVEYEFLTQNATAFLPSGSMPYQQYVTKDVKQSIVSYMNKLGYNTYGMHSWDKSGYSREKIYKLLGFDNALFKDKMLNLQYGIGQYTTDESTYNVYYDIMNNKEKGEKNFSFIVTMQNHMPYVYIKEEVNKFVPQNDAAISYFQSEYFADKALEGFINYLKNYDEKTILLFFGDHQPNVNQDYWYHVREGYDTETAMQVVPFFIWANYDIEEKSGIETSSNYLESLLLETAGMPTDSYTKYIQELRKELPVITNHYVIDKDGNRFNANDKNSPYYDKLQEYWRVIYYHMFNK